MVELQNMLQLLMQPDYCQLFKSIGQSATLDNAKWREQVEAQRRSASRILKLCANQPISTKEYGANAEEASFELFLKCECSLFLG
jgi:hypothetical protein